MSAESASSSPGRSTGTAHFRVTEFACPHCGVHLVRPQLLFRLELLRKAIGRPIPIVSGYRCPVHNLEAGGAADSQHMYGAAADIPLGLVTVNQALHAGFTGIGRQKGTVRHVDVRDGSVAQWSY
jgi:zinc D-Ala-D-Ala carboxypeptidase